MDGIRHPIVARVIQDGMEGTGLGFCEEKSSLEEERVLSSEEIPELPVQLEGYPTVTGFVKEYSGNSLFDREVSFDGTEVKLKAEITCLVDTGSDITCMSDECFENLQSLCQMNFPTLPVRPIQIRGAIGQRSLRIQRLASLPVRFDKHEEDTGFLIVPRLTCSVILGFDWL